MALARHLEDPLVKRLDRNVQRRQNLKKHLRIHKTIALRQPREKLLIVYAHFSSLYRSRYPRLGQVPGRSGTVHENWLAERGEQFRSGIHIATLDPFPGTARTPSLGQLQDATSVLDAFHIVKLAGDALDEVRRRVQQERLREASTADEAHISVEVAYLLTQQVREVFHQATPAQGRHLAAHLIQRLPACPIPEIARLGRTLRKWKDTFLAYFDTGGASNGPTEAINGIIELGRRTARGYRNPTNYQLRMLLIAGGLDASTHTQL